jgi:VCBS repeat-containing protein
MFAAESWRETMATVSVTSTTGLLQALKSAHSGDTIMLSPGTYSAVNIYQYHSPGTVTITSENPLNPATISSLNINESSGLKFSNLTFATTLYNAPSSSQAPTPFAVYSSQNVAFDHISVHGTLDNNPQNDVNGLRIEGSANVSVTNSTFQQLYNAITELSNNNVVISNNNFHDLRNDGIDNGGTSNIVIAGNSFTNFYPVGQVGAAGDHADAIQFWTSNTTSDASNISVVDNTVLRGSGSYVQGIFMTDQVGLGYNDVTVTDNTIIGGEFNGIDIEHANGVTVAGNLVEGYEGMPSWIKLANDTNAMLNNNIASSFTLINNNLLSQALNQSVGVVQAVSSLQVTPIKAVAQVSTLALHGTANGNAMSGDTGAGLYVADVGVGTKSQQQLAAVGAANFAGSYGTLTINANGTYSYTETKDGLTIGQSYVDHFTLTLAETNGGAASSTLDIQINVTGLGDGAKDNLIAGATTATLSGFGAGSTLTGGSAKDVFDFTTTAQSTLATQTLIEHFQAGDIIDLSAIDPRFHIVSKFDGHPDELVISHLGTGNWEIYGDTTGHGTADLAIHLLGVAPSYALSIADFHI